MSTLNFGPSPFPTWAYLFDQWSEGETFYLFKKLQVQFKG